MTSVIDRIGGEAAVRALVERFYDLIETVPEGRQILHLHFRGHGISHVRAAQFEFLCGFFGRAAGLYGTARRAEFEGNARPRSDPARGCRGLADLYGAGFAGRGGFRAG